MFNDSIEIDEVIKLANQSKSQVKGALVIEAEKIRIILIFENKTVSRSKHCSNRIRKKCYVLIKKDTSVVKNTLLQWILQSILENQTFQRIAKFIVVDSYEMNFMNGIAILVKVDEMYNILHSASHCWSRDEDGIG